MFKMKVLVFIVSIYSVCSSLKAEDPIVTLPNGKIRGSVVNAKRNTTFYSFLDVPFGKPPVGKLRFQAPEPAENWEGILDTKENKRICYQVPSNSDLETEDCLYLNVYTPVNPSTSENASLPVMVYIFGGGFVQGQATYNNNGPQYFMEYGVVVVTLNYRVGPFGFLSTGDLIIPGNNGLKDQNLGLKWVQNNIKLFGGDSDKVTIFGHSAGGASVTYQIISEKSEGLFRGGIAQSGSALAPWSFQRHAKEIAYNLTRHIESTFSKINSSEELLEFLQSQPAAVIDEASRIFVETPEYEQMMQGFFFGPVLEVQHSDAFITEGMYESVEQGNINKVPLLIGITSEEAIYRAQSGEYTQNLLELYDEKPWLFLNEDLHIEDSNEKIEVGKLIRDIYTNGSLIQDDLVAGIKFFSDQSFARGITKYAQLQSLYTDVYFYKFSYYGELGGSSVILNGAGKVAHGQDNNYLWKASWKNDIDQYPENDVLAARRFLKLFTDFAKELNPTPEKSELLQNLILPKVTNETVPYLDIDEILEVKTDPIEDRFNRWNYIYKKYGVRPFDTY